MSAKQSRQILGLILARGGSKRLPGKNLRPLHGRPLIAWTIEAACSCPAITTTVVSTDSQAIADVAMQHGARVPFLRPEMLAQDHSTSADSAIHAVEFLAAQGEEFDAIMLLEPTSPLRADGDIASTIDMLLERWDDLDAVVTVGQMHREHPLDIKRKDIRDGLSSWMPVDKGQPDCTPAWYPYGGIYLIKTAILRSQRTFYPERLGGKRVQRWQNYEVDDEIDFLCIESIIRHFKGRLPEQL
ncbi:acylneuraminate cytidylyltransferase family protein [Acidovorax sp.]|uniref:acylneuraminate cytidylyltransferase family protein n=1 Tax=Acidovorax sp. TaxID=1872122 RepID=UPI0025C6B45F|nr:acylneuraminate cytidylyltransferase family protein [Acidovorax sp.]MBL7087251.1 acylneuraminate cytidylyltransferase family protein [Acidovorax sp.]